MGRPLHRCPSSEGERAQMAAIASVKLTRNGHAAANI
jgi:hypothetical protein